MDSGWENIFGLRRTRAFVTQTLSKTQIAVTHIKCDRVNNGLTSPLPCEDAYLITLQLRDCPRHDLWLDNRAMRSGHLRPGAISVYDLRLSPIVNSVSPFHSLHFYLPRTALTAIADMEGRAKTKLLCNDPGLGVEDAIIHGLGSALLPAFQRPAEANRVFIDHITMAAAAHALRTYGAAVRPAPRVMAGLAPWQERRAKESLSTRLDGDVAIADLAKDCGLSISEFSRAFQLSTGTLPHRWLLQHRIDKALLSRRPRLSLDEVAAVCGFANRDHLMRTFVRAAGSRPEAWRRE